MYFATAARERERVSEREGERERERVSEREREGDFETVSRCTSCTEGHARADADILWCVRCADWTTSPKKARKQQE